MRPASGGSRDRATGRRRRAAWAIVAISVLLASACATDDVLAPPVPTADVSDFDLCDPGEADDQIEFATIYEVDDGRLRSPCLGISSDAIEAAWEQLERLAPRAELRPIRYFGGFEDPGDGASVIEAYVEPIKLGTSYRMFVNVAAAERGGDELVRTLAHELTHVFVTTLDQFDYFVTDVARCDTYFDGSGCASEGSLMADWVEAFWSDDELERLPSGEPDISDGEERCSADDGFFGPYAAANPDEDFAEAFAAYVTRTAPATDGQDDRLEWMADRDELDVFLDEAVRNAVGPYPNTFERCG